MVAGCILKINNDDYLQLSSSANKIDIYKDTTVSGILNVGVGATSSKIKAHSTQQGDTGHIELHSQSPWIFKLEFITTHPTPRSFIFQKGSTYFGFHHSNQSIAHYKSLVNSSEDRLKENEVIIENACETLSKLRPQLYDKNRIWEMMTLQPGLKKVV